MEFSRRYSATAGGAIWMFAGPLATIFAIWFALEIGMGASGRFGHAFGSNFVIGLAAWLFFADATQSAAISITSSPHLVKKVVFPVWVLPMAAALAAFFVHLLVLTIATSVLWLLGLPLRIHLLSLLTWMGLLLILVGAIGLLLASYNVYVRDVAVLTPNIIGLLFWLTPIVWPVQQLSEKLQAVTLANPMAMIIEGYRSSVNADAVLPATASLPVFLFIIGGLALFAIWTYRRVRPNFSDAL
jgi:ABC-type polysaccharide/polyol phosphate export permease